MDFRHNNSLAYIQFGFHTHGWSKCVLPLDKSVWIQNTFVDVWNPNTFVQISSTFFSLKTKQNISDYRMTLCFVRTFIIDGETNRIGHYSYLQKEHCAKFITTFYCALIVKFLNYFRKLQKHRKTRPSKNNNLITQRLLWKESRR